MFLKAEVKTDREYFFQLTRRAGTISIYEDKYGVCVCVSHSVMSDSVILWTVAHQAPLSIGFPGQKYCCG